MVHVASFTFNPFQENTYILYDETKEGVIIDPGCYTEEEREELTRFISSEKIKPVKLLNTHCHTDHVLGNAFVARTYQLELEMHKGEIPVLQMAGQFGMMMGIQMEASPQPSVFLEEGDTVTFGNASLSVLFTPGHSPASISFYNEADEFVIAGDVLFLQSIGRTDLPGGDTNTLLESIRTQLFPLGDAVKVYPGHGPATTIGFEKVNNPFLNRW